VKLETRINKRIKGSFILVSQVSQRGQAAINFFREQRIENREQA